MSIRQPYIRPMKHNWWLKNSFYLKYMIREGSSIATAIYSLVLLGGLFRLAQGETAFANWLQAMQSPVAIIFHLVALFWVLYHSVTWFNLAPKAADIWFKDKKLPDSVIVKSMYALLVIISLLILVIVSI